MSATSSVNAVPALYCVNIQRHRRDLGVSIVLPAASELMARREALRLFPEYGYGLALMRVSLVRYVELDWDNSRFTIAQREGPRAIPACAAKTVKRIHKNLPPATAGLLTASCRASPIIDSKSWKSPGRFCSDQSRSQRPSSEQKNKSAAQQFALVRHSSLRYRNNSMRLYLRVVRLTGLVRTSSYTRCKSRLNSVDAYSPSWVLATDVHSYSKLCMPFPEETPLPISVRRVRLNLGATGNAVAVPRDCSTLRLPSAMVVQSV